MTLCTFGDGASNQGTFGETLNLAALWRLPVVFMVVNNQFGMGTSLSRHSAVTDLQRKGESLGVPGMRCDGMDILDTHRVVSEALARVREERRPLLDRGRHLPLPRPLDGRPRGLPHQGGGRRSGASATRSPRSAPCWNAKVRSQQSSVEQIERDAMRQVDEAVEFAERSPFPDPDTLYEDVYVLDEQAHGHYHWSPQVVREARTPQPCASTMAETGATCAARAAMTEMRYRDALKLALREEMRRDEDVILLGEDIGVFGGAFKVTSGLLEEFGERRVRDTPISENTIVGWASEPRWSGCAPSSS